jgi:hypothetical protein
MPTEAVYECAARLLRAVHGEGGGVAGLSAKWRAKKPRAEVAPLRS